MIMDDLESRGCCCARMSTKHTYPYCWRCDTPLLYYAKPSGTSRRRRRKTR